MLEEVMSGLNVYRSNRMETLVDLLVSRLASAPLPDPFEAEQIVVGNLGMEGWLSRQLAQQLGVCANVRFLFPGEVLDRSLTALTTDPGEPPPPGDPWSPEALAWSIMACLPQLLEAPEHREAFKLVRTYLEWEGEAHGGAGQGDDGAAPVVTRHRYTLARQVADVFDRYAVFRPRWALAWSAGEAAPGLDLPPELAWQPLLWRAVQQRVDRLEHPRPHLAGRVALAAEAARDAAAAPWPGFHRLTIFGVSSLPPIYLEVLDMLSGLAEVDLYLLCPSPEYWEDLVSRGEQAARRRRMARDELTHHLRRELEQAQRPEGAPLLASLGRIARDFQVVLEALPGGYDDRGGPSPEGLFSDPVRDSGLPMVAAGDALHWLQSDIYNVRHPSQVEVTRRRLRSSDDSVQLHACHGPTRQVEVLRDVLLGLFEDHPHLQPRDVVVMTPDIETYAPLVSAVFDDGPRRRLEQAGRPERGPDGWGPAGAPRIPYRVADLSLRRVNPVADALLRVLELASGRMEASAVLDLLGLEPVRLRFGMDEDDLPQIQRWIRDSGIRWGADVEHRRQEGMPADAGNTWSFGLRRLALGVTMDDELRLAHGVSPYDDMEGEQVGLLGRFFDLCATLVSQTRKLSGARPLAQWAEHLDAALDAVTATSARAAWLTRQVRDTLVELRDHAADAAMEAAVELEAVRAFLEGRFEIPAGRDVNPGGAVTFCALVPMRSIPHRVLCLLGMDEDAFPRNPGTVGFDLTSRSPRVGDRDPRDEDRLLLLEALLAARDHLVITYTGHDVRTNKEQAPAAPVDELLDVFDLSFPDPAEGIRPSAWMTTHHRLQAFSPDNFRPLHRGVAAGAHPWSFDRRLRDAAARLQAARLQDHHDEVPFVTAGDAPEPAVKPEISLDDLIRFYEHPVKHLLRRGLHLDLDERADLVEDREPIELDALQRWSLANDMLRAPVRGASLSQALESLVAQGKVPLGTPGAVLLDERLEVASEALRLAEQQRQGMVELPALPVDLTLAGARLQGTVDGRLGSAGGGEGRCVLVAVGAASGKRFVAPWIKHLTWLAQRPEEDSRVVQVLATRDDQALVCKLFEYKVGEDALLEQPAEYARRRLANLVELYLRGMSEPIPLFENSSFTFARLLHGKLCRRYKGNDPPAELQSRQHAWVVGDATWNAVRQWQRRTYHDSPPGDLDDPYVAQVHGDRCALTADGDESTREVDAEFATLALRFWWPLLQAKREPGGQP